jgi:pyruvate,water dikinase
VGPPSLRFTVIERKATLERQQRLMPPTFIGVPPNPATVSSDMANAMRHFRGYGVEASKDPDVLMGTGASKGIVRGRARVLAGLHEADRLQNGDILVCRTTAPPWTPLFSIAGGIVTDGGGILSHSAICAREYGIPCVVGTQTATQRIPDGAMLEIDGTKGTVRIEP